MYYRQQALYASQSRQSKSPTRTRRRSRRLKSSCNPSNWPSRAACSWSCRATPAAAPRSDGASRWSILHFLRSSHCRGHTASAGKPSASSGPQRNERTWISSAQVLGARGGAGERCQWRRLRAVPAERLGSPLARGLARGARLDQFAGALRVADCGHADRCEPVWKSKFYGAF